MEDKLEPDNTFYLDLIYRITLNYYQNKRYVQPSYLLLNENFSSQHNKSPHLKLNCHHSLGRF